MKTLLRSLAIACAAMCLFAMSATCAFADKAASPADRNGAWTKKSGCMYYVYDDGGKATGLTQIDGKTYYFDKKGVQRVGWREVDGAYRYFQIENGAKGSMVKSKVVNGIKLYKNGIAKENRTALAEIKIMVAAQKRCDKITDPLDSQASKLRATFSWVWKDCRERGSYAFSTGSGWHRKFAWDIFNTKSGSCDSMSIAYAYLANACGAKSVQVRASGGHTWALVNGKVCDPEQANQGLGWSAYMHAGMYGSAGIYKVLIAKRTKQWSTAKATNSKAAKQKDGWVKKGGTYYYYKGGKKLKGKWLAKSGKKYYLTGNGSMATKSAKVKGVYYVFDNDGALLTGKKTRNVKVDGVTYRVTKAGKAVSGWANNNTRYYFATGELACGIRYISKKLTAFSASGVYNAALTLQLRTAAKAGADATELVRLLGSPKTRETVSTCRLDYLGGLEVTYTYDHIKVLTYCGETGPEYLNYIEAL